MDQANLASKLVIQDCFFPVTPSLHGDSKVRLFSILNHGHLGRDSVLHFAVNDDIVQLIEHCFAIVDAGFDVE